MILISGKALLLWYHSKSHNKEKKKTELPYIWGFKQLSFQKIVIIFSDFSLVWM